MHTVVCSQLSENDISKARTACLPLLFVLLMGLMTGLTSHAQDDTGAESQHERQIQRLGDVDQEEQWEMDLTPTVPRSEEPANDIPLEQKINGYLRSARQAMQEGRIDQPESNSAWLYFRSVLDLDPENADAQQGLLAVQQEMVSRALEYARELDFESADRILEDATYVRKPQDLIAQAYEEIASFRNRRVEELEIAAVTAMDAGDFNRAERELIELIALGGADTTVNQLRRRLEEARVYGGFRPGQVIRDHFLNQGKWTPETVVILAGSFVMGSTAFEEGRQDNEGPQHRVTFRRGFAIGKREVSVEEFKEFVDLSGYKTDAERSGYSIVYDQYSGRLTKRDDIHWEMNYEGAEANMEDPVVHVSWNDANAFVTWLARCRAKQSSNTPCGEARPPVIGGETARPNALWKTLPVKATVRVAAGSGPLILQATRTTIGARRR